MKIEVSDEEGKLRAQADGLDQEIRRLNITVPVGLHELTPPTAEAQAIDFLKRHIVASRELIQRHKDTRQSRELASKAAEEAEKERIDNEAKGRKKDSLGWYTPISGTFSYVIPLPNDPEPQRRAIVDRLRQIRNYGGIKRTRVDESAGHVRVQYLPATEGQRDDLTLIGVVFQMRNGFAVHEAEVVNERLAHQGDAEAARREQEEERRWAVHANN